MRGVIIARVKPSRPVYRLEKAVRTIDSVSHHGLVCLTPVDLPRTEKMFWVVVQQGRKKKKKIGEDIERKKTREEKGERGKERRKARAGEGTDTQKERLRPA